MAVKEESLYDVIIVGGGPAGLTAAIYLARACYRVIVVEMDKFGGQITITADIVNYPGVTQTSGKELTEIMHRQGEQFGAEYLLARVESITAKDGLKCVKTTKGDLYGLGILIATGAHPRKIGFTGEEKFQGRGVAYCATCDGEFFTGKQVFVVGGGYAAAEESIFLTKYASHVTVLIREEDFSCAKTTAQATKEHEKITVCTNTVVESVDGDQLVRAIRYRNIKTGEVTEYRDKNNDVIGVFVFAGYEPETTLVKDMVEVNEGGYIVTDSSQRTSVEGIYAAGDVCVKSLRQVVTATGDGALAAVELERYAAKKQKELHLYPKRKAQQKKQQENQLKDKPDSRLFDEKIVEQLMVLFSKMQQDIILKLYVDEQKASKELEEYMTELAALTKRIRIEKIRMEDEKKVPYVSVCYSDGEEAGMEFHGVPGGHEFTPFVLGIYNVAGPGQSIDAAIKQKIQQIKRNVSIKILTTLSCSYCPDTVAAAQLIAAHNMLVKTEIYDANLFPGLRERYQAMSVPCIIIDEKEPVFGKHDIEELLMLIFD